HVFPRVGGTIDTQVPDAFVLVPPTVRIRTRHIQQNITGHTFLWHTSFLPPELCKARRDTALSGGRGPSPADHGSPGTGCDGQVASMPGTVGTAVTRSARRRAGDGFLPSSPEHRPRAWR